MFNKTKYIRSRKYLDGARGQSCVRCECSDGTIVAAHYCGFMAHVFGFGKGIKVHDVLVADLCLRCHVYFDQYQGTDKDRRGFEFLICIMKTIIRRYEQGILKL